MTTNIPITLIDPNPWQTRQNDPDPDYVKELALDIAANGLLQAPAARVVDRSGLPVTTIDLSDNVGLPNWIAQNGARVQLAFGHNRLAAFKWLVDVQPTSNLVGDWSQMPLELRILTNEQMADMAWAENERRRSVDPISRALAVQHRIESFSWSHDEAARHLGISRPAVSNMLRLLKLPEHVRTALADGRLSARQAEALLALYTLPEEMLQQAEQRGWSDARPSVIFKQAIEGNTSSDEIRRKVAYLCQQYAENLSSAGWKVADEFPVGDGVRSAACKACDRRHVENNLCLDTTCYQRKKRIHENRQILEISQQTGYPVYDGSLSYNELSDLSTWSRKDRDFPAILQTGCKNLVLVPYTGKSNLPGVTGALLKCSKREGFCSCLKGLDMQRELERRQAAEEKARAAAAAQAPAPQPVKTLAEVFLEEEAQDLADLGVQPGEAPPATSADLHELVRLARQEKRQTGRYKAALVAAFARQVAAFLATADVSAFRCLAYEIAPYKFSSEKTSAFTVDDLLLAIGEHMADRALPYEPRSAQHILDNFNSYLARFGLAALAMPEIDETKPSPQST